MIKSDDIAPWKGLNKQTKETKRRANIGNFKYRHTKDMDLGEFEFLLHGYHNLYSYKITKEELNTIIETTYLLIQTTFPYKK